MDKKSYPPSGIDLPALVADLERATEAWDARQSPPMPLWADCLIWGVCLFMAGAVVATLVVWLT